MSQALEIVGIDYLERNKLQRSRRLFMNYMMVMQFIFSAITLALIGYYVGGRINPDGDLNLILTGVGLGLGVMIGFITLIKMIQSEERYERSIRH